MSVPRQARPGSPHRESPPSPSEPVAPAPRARWSARRCAPSSTKVRPHPVRATPWHRRPAAGGPIRRISDWTRMPCWSDETCWSSALLTRARMMAGREALSCRSKQNGPRPTASSRRVTTSRAARSPRRTAPGGLRRRPRQQVGDGLGLAGAGWTFQHERPTGYRVGDRRELGTVRRHRAHRGQGVQVLRAGRRHRIAERFGRGVDQV